MTETDCCAKCAHRNKHDVEGFKISPNAQAANIGFCRTYCGDNPLLLLTRDDEWCANFEPKWQPG